MNTDLEVRDAVETTWNPAIADGEVKSLASQVPRPFWVRCAGKLPESLAQPVMSRPGGG